MIIRGCFAWFVTLSVFGLGLAVADDKKDDKKTEERKGTAKGENWIEIKADGEEKGRRYVPHWRGGAPNAGGGPDKEMIAKLKDIPVNSRVRMEWVFEERPRVEKIEILKKSDAKKSEKK
jgi:hypothetical protein